MRDIPPSASFIVDAQKRSITGNVHADFFVLAIPELNASLLLLSHSQPQILIETRSLILRGRGTPIQTHFLRQPDNQPREP